LTKAVLNSSVIIALSTLDYLNKIKSVFEEVIIANAVYREICIAGQGLIGERELEEAIKTRQVEAKDAKNELLITALLDSLDIGEAETIALAIEEHADVIVLDDKTARRKAKALKLNVIGTLRILRMMYDAKVMSKKKFIESLVKLRETGFRISDAIINKVTDEL
jgi:predicted nucleic acid-binding protein